MCSDDNIIHDDVCIINPSRFLIPCMHLAGVLALRRGPSRPCGGDLQAPAQYWNVGGGIVGLVKPTPCHAAV